MELQGHRLKMRGIALSLRANLWMLQDTFLGFQKDPRPLAMYRSKRSLLVEFGSSSSLVLSASVRFDLENAVQDSRNFFLRTN